MPDAPFRFDDRAARAWLARASAQADRTVVPADDGYDADLPFGITRAWLPAADETGHAVTALIDRAPDYGIIACPPGTSIAFGFEPACCEDECPTYRYFLTLGRNAPDPLIIASPWRPLEQLAGGEAGPRGTEAALLILREAAETASGLLALLDRVRPAAGAA